MNHVGIWSAGSRNRVLPVVLLAAVAVSAPILAPKTGIALAGLLGVAVVLYLFAATLEGKIEVPLLFWIAVFPLGYYFVSFPRDRAIITLDRMMMGILLLGMALAPSRKSIKVPDDLRRSAVVWGCFVLAGVASLAKVVDMLFSCRLVFDSFFLPAIMGWCVIRNLEVRRHLVSLHTVVCIMCAYVAAIGAVEMATGTDLLPLPGQGLYFAGSVLRPNGPFATNHSFALIGLISFLFLLFLRRAIGNQMLGGQRLLHMAGVTSALAMALMPLFRSVGITLLLILLLDMYFDREPRKLIVRLAILSSALAAVVIFSVKAPEVYEDRSDSANLNSRIAEQQQTLALFEMHPITGVGLGGFTIVAAGRTEAVGSYKGAESVDAPHNNLGEVLAETGLLGFLPYIAAQVLLIMAFRKLRTLRTHPPHTAWIFFVYVFLSYWISGLSLTAGYYSDVNLWYLFVLMVLYKYAITEEGSWNHAGSRIRSRLHHS